MSFVSAGIDVSCKDLHVAMDGPKPLTGTFANTPEDHKKLAKWLTKKLKPKSRMRVVLEPTGIYSLDLALALAKHKRIEVMVANPRAVKAFAKVIGQRGKTDPLDAKLLLAFGKVRPFVPFAPPSQSALELRQLSRAVAGLVREQTRMKNRVHTASATTTTASLLLEDLRDALKYIAGRIDRLRKAAFELINKDKKLSRRLELLVSITGIAAKSGLLILGELVAMPPDIDIRQLVALAGLDPRHRQSGNMRGKTPISKAGNRYLRGALYMPAMTAIRVDPHVKRFADRMKSRGKHPLEAVVAVMRKLLHAIFGMFKSDTLFDATRFCGPVQSVPRSTGNRIAQIGPQ